MKTIQWVHYRKTCSDSAHKYLSAETYKPITGDLTLQLLKADCEYWAGEVNDDHEVGHGGNYNFRVVDFPPKEWVEKEIKETTLKIEEDKKWLNLLKTL